MSKHLHFILGASIGTGIQPTAVAVLEHEVWKNEKWKPETVALSLRYLERIPLDAGYPDTVSRIDTLLKTTAIKDEECDKASDLVLDVTGSGRAVVELFDRAAIAPIVVTITGAGVREEEAKDWRIPKVELVGNLQVLYQTERLKMASALELVPTLIDELRDFKMRPPRIDPNDPETWREGQFDDLVFAVALAAWRASRHVPTPQIVRDHQNQRLDEFRAETDRWVI